MKRIALSEVKDRLSEYLDLAEKEEIIITRHGKPAGVLIGFWSEEDWFDYRLYPAFPNLYLHSEPVCIGCQVFS